jgi:hypothetical protein
MQQQVALAQAHSGHQPDGVQRAQARHLSVGAVSVGDLQEHVFQRAAGRSLGAHFVERAGGHQLAVVDDADAVAQLFRHVQQVGGNEDGDAARCGRQQAFLHIARGARIEAVDGFIEYQHGRIVDQGAGQAQAFFHAQRVVDGVVFGRFLQAEFRQQALRARASARL